MNEEKEVLVRQSKWNGRRIILFYWFAIVFLGSSAAVGISSTLLNPKYSVEGYDHSAIADPVTGEYHPDDCVPCHQAEVDGWNLTKHSYILQYYTNATGTYIRHTTSGDDYNVTEFINDGGCCHVTQRYNDTSVNASGEWNVWDIGVSCGACHEEPGAEATYFTDPGTGFPFEKTCSGRCHIPGSRGKTWVQTGHSESFDDLLAATGDFDYCMHCMAGESTYEDLSFGNIDCVTCHDPHNEDGVRYEHELRKNGTVELCGTCHGDVVEFLTDTTFATPHAIIDDCTTCHGYYWDGNDTVGEASILHNWTLVLEDACGNQTGCHEGEEAARIAWMEAIQGDTEALIASYGTQLENVSGRIAEAKAVEGVNMTLIGDAEDLLDEAADLAHDVTGEPSTGFHNGDLAEDKLKLALAKLDEAYGIVDALIPEPETTTTTTTTTEETTTEEETTSSAPAIGVLGLIGILSLAVLFTRKRR
ncbi:hypothetical protein CEE45_11830 [Candidatus Heimdallarchaeota archaeon B3_Heim]|nr:MAG: hypothetical protein CEE45_11830 [Candidatus Heimdallarchaeota archaeon B3_Heim]